MNNKWEIFSIYLAVDLRRNWVASQLNHLLLLAQTVDGLTSVVGKVLLPHIGNGQGVLLVVTGQDVAPLHVQLHAVLEPDHLWGRLSMNYAGHHLLLTNTSLHPLLDWVDVGQIQHMKVDLKLIFFWLLIETLPQFCFFSILLLEIRRTLFYFCIDAQILYTTFSIYLTGGRLSHPIGSSTNVDPTCSPGHTV